MTYFVKNGKRESCPTRYEPGAEIPVRNEPEGWFCSGWMARSLGVGVRGASIVEAMVIDMNEAQVRALEQVRQLVAGTQALKFRRVADDERRIEKVLRRSDYRRLGRADKGSVQAYLQHLSGYSRAQLTRLVSWWAGGKPPVKKCRRPEHASGRRDTAAELALLADVDGALGPLSGARHGLRSAPPTRCFHGRSVRAPGRHLRGTSAQPTTQRGPRLPFSDAAGPSATRS